MLFTLDCWLSFGACSLPGPHLFPFPHASIFASRWPRFGDQGSSGRHAVNGARGLGRVGVSGNHGQVAVHPGVFLVCRLFVVYVVMMHDA